MDDSSDEGGQLVQEYGDRGSKRKKVRNKVPKREQQKRQRYNTSHVFLSLFCRTKRRIHVTITFRNSATDLLLNRWTRPCTHGASSVYKCDKVKISDLIRAKNNVYSTSNRSNQNEKISYLLSPKSPQRRRNALDEPTKRHTLQVEYFVSIMKVILFSLLVFISFLKNNIIDYRYQQKMASARECVVNYSSHF